MQIQVGQQSSGIALHCIGSTESRVQRSILRKCCSSRSTVDAQAAPRVLTTSIQRESDAALRLPLTLHFASLTDLQLAVKHSAVVRRCEQIGLQYGMQCGNMALLVPASDGPPEDSPRDI